MGEVDKDAVRECIHWVGALMTAMEQSLAGDDPANVWKYGGYKVFARKYNQVVEAVAARVALPPMIDTYNMDAIRGAGDTIAFQQKELFESVFANASILKGYLESRLGVVEDETMALRDFLQAHLRSAMLRLPEKERDVQDAVEQLLIGRGLQKGEDYDREVGRVKISSKEVIPDFILMKLGLAVEIKLVPRATRVKEVIDEVNADIASYSKGYRSILFVVYDLGHIRDEIEFRSDLESAPNVSVIVVKQ